MFFQQLTSILKRQHIAAYIETFLIRKRENPNFKPQPRLAQVASMTSITDGHHEFPCKLSSRVRKGSHIRMIRWELNFDTFQIIVHEFQLLSCGGYEICHSRRWDPEKIKLELNSNAVALSRDFVILFHPNETINEPKLSSFCFETMKEVFKLIDNSFQDSHSTRATKIKAQVCEP